MSEFLTNPCFQRDLTNTDNKPWALKHDALRYRSTLLGYTLTIPVGFRTDFATVPWVFRRLLPKDGPWTLAAVIHDYLCAMKFAEIDNELAAHVMLEAMVVLNTPKWACRAIFNAVRYFGPRWH